MARGRRAGHQRPATPMRRCVGCKKIRPYAELLRLAAQDGQVVPDARKSLPGRGCSICRDPGCARAAIRSRSISRALKGVVPDPSIDRLLSWVHESRSA